MNVASCGLGVNSIAGIMEASDQGVIFDEILFANTGRGKKLGERIVTYEYLHKYFNPWLAANGQPKVTFLHTVDKDGEILSLYEDCYNNKTLPAIVFGFKTCSQKFKGQTQLKFLNNNEKSKQTWANGGKVIKWIFYDADEPGRAKDYSDDKFEVRYFLIEQNWGRYECEEKIKDAGLPLPPKSSCKFCPSMKPYQIIDLYKTEISGFYEAIELERNAINGGKLNNIVGLGRTFSWWNLIVTYRYVSLFKRAMVLVPGKVMDRRVIKMVKKINRSKADILIPKVSSNSAEVTVCGLFTTRQDMPCGCYDGD